MLAAFLSAALLHQAGSDYTVLKKRFDQPLISRSSRVYARVPYLALGQKRDWVRSILEEAGITIPPPGAPNTTQEAIWHFEWKGWNHPASFLPAALPSNTAGTATIEFDPVSLEVSGLRVGEISVAQLPLPPKLIATVPNASLLPPSSSPTTSETPGITLDPEEDDGRGSLRSPLKFEEIPPKIWQAIIAAEDQHFLEHKGWDPRGLFRAIWVNLKTRSFAQGGSTITQQLTKNLLQRRTKDPVKKLSELLYSMRLETEYPKEKILERYLNEVYLGQIGPYAVHGISEGARLFFGKAVSQLSLSEIALMAGLIRGPAYYSPYKHLDRALERMRWVLGRMVETEMIAGSERDEAIQDSRQLAGRLLPPQTQANAAPAFMDRVQTEVRTAVLSLVDTDDDLLPSLSIYTTLDLALQKQTENSLPRQLTELEKSLSKKVLPSLQTALIGVDVTTGGILTLLGARQLQTSRYNRALIMKRQMGSTFKPIVYLSALQERLDRSGTPYTAGYPLEDAPYTLHFQKHSQTWQPRNDDVGQFRGWISAQTALSHSINTATARLAQKVGPAALLKTAQSLGLLTDKTAFLPAHALGSDEASPFQVAEAYTMLAHGGTRLPLHTVIHISLQDAAWGHLQDSAGDLFHQSPPREIEDREGPQSLPFALLTEMLRGPLREGTATRAASLGWTRPSAGKTGTTNGYRDAWFAGFSPQRLAVVWVGWDEGQAPAGVKLTGARAALPIWVQWMKAAHRMLPEVDFPAHPLAARHRVHRRTGRPVEDGCSDLERDTQTLEVLYPTDLLPEDSSVTESPCNAPWPPSQAQGEWDE